MKEQREDGTVTPGIDGCSSLGNALETLPFVEDGSALHEVAITM